MSVCRSCLRNNLRLLTSCKPSLPTITLSRSSGNVPLRRYTAAPTASGQPASAPLIAHQEETAEEKEWNSFSLRNKVEHWITMKDPEGARRLLQRARVPQSVYSWNLVIKYYAHQGNYTDAYKTYQQVLILGIIPSIRATLLLSPF
jgi:pentatricopeptide repeat protein